jgi:glyoxylase-like metal-dependent hydrolase (beta-lactamase superfamily II)
MLHLIDSLHLETPLAICVALLEASPDELVMIDCGPANVVTNVVREMRKRGLRPENVRHLLATHIHLDHNGGAWRWQKEFGTVVGVHPKGAPHLIDPTRLVASATRIYGEEMDRLWGPIESIPADSVQATADGENFQIGRLHLQIVETPGHAQHHNAYWLPRERLLFAGDIAGVAIGKGPVLPPFPPPDIDLESWHASIAKIRRLDPAELCLTHFGRFSDVGRHLQELSGRLSAWAEWMKNALRTGKSEEAIVPEFRKFVEQQIVDAGVSEEIAVYEQADPAAMSVMGLSRYWKKHHPEALNVQLPDGG